MESRSSGKSFKERRIEQQLDELAERIKALPPDRIQALQEDVLASANRDRQARFADRQRNQGRIRPNWWLDADTVEEIRRQASARGGIQQDAVNTILKELLTRRGGRKKIECT
jgi:hypothetical protein